MFLYFIWLQLRLKTDFWKYLEQLLFKTHQLIEFSTKLSNAKISQATLLVVSPHDALMAILKILGTLTRNICDGVSFLYSIGDRLDSLICLKRTLPKAVFWVSSEIFNLGVFPNIP